MSAFNPAIRCLFFVLSAVIIGQASVTAAPTAIIGGGGLIEGVLDLPVPGVGNVDIGFFDGSFNSVYNSTFPLAPPLFLTIFADGSSVASALANFLNTDGGNPGGVGPGFSSTIFIPFGVPAELTFSTRLTSRSATSWQSSTGYSAQPRTSSHPSLKFAVVTPSSTGPSPIPAPGAIILGVLGLATTSLLKRKMRI